MIVFNDGNEDHEGDPSADSEDFHNALTNGTLMQQLRDDGDGGDVNEPSRSERENPMGLLGHLLGHETYNSAEHRTCGL